MTDKEYYNYSIKEQKEHRFDAILIQWAKSKDKEIQKLVEDMLNKKYIKKKNSQIFKEAEQWLKLKVKLIHNRGK